MAATGVPTHIVHNVNQNQEGHPEVQLTEKPLLHDLSVRLINVRTRKCWAIGAARGTIVRSLAVVAWNDKRGAV